jgi:hypothetical protein
MYRASFAASLLALVLFVWAQARGMDPANLFRNGPSHGSSSTRSTYHK